MSLLQKIGLSSPEDLKLIKRTDRIKSICRLNNPSINPAAFLNDCITLLRREYNKIRQHFDKKKIAKSAYLQQWIILETILYLLEAIYLNKWEDTILTPDDIMTLKSYFYEEKKRNIFLIPISDLLNIDDHKRVTSIPKTKYSYMLIDIACLILNDSCSVLHTRLKPFNASYAIY